MITVTSLDPVKCWLGRHNGIRFQIKLSQVGQSHTPYGAGCWTFYIYLTENHLLDFEAHWLEPKLIKIVPKSPGYVTHDYFDTPVSRVDGWNGGVTYYAKHGELAGHRVVEFGCDYNHLWDNERGYALRLEDILADVETTINNLAPLLKPTP